MLVRNKFVHEGNGVLLFCRINDDGRLRKVPSPTINIKSASAIQQVEPNVDFELDIKVAVSSGQCVLHPKESKTLIDYDDPKR